MHVADLMLALSAFDPDLPVVIPADRSGGTVDFTLVKHVAIDLVSTDPNNTANLQLSDKREREFFEAVLLTRRQIP